MASHHALKGLPWRRLCIGQYSSHQRTHAFVQVRQKVTQWYSIRPLTRRPGPPLVRHSHLSTCYFLLQ